MFPFPKSLFPSLGLMLTLAFPIAAQGAEVPPAAAADKGGGSGQVIALRELLDKWVDMQKALSKEKSEAKDAMLILQQRIELLTRELEDLKARKVKGELEVTEADKKKSDLVDKKTAIVSALADLDNAVPALEVELRALQPLLPDPVREKLTPLFSRVPDAGKPAKMSLSERYQNVVGILNEASKSNQEISVVSEIRTLDDGKPAEVKTLYIGLGQAYFVNATGKKSGTGRPGPQGWIWQQDDSIAASVRLSIGMLQSKSTAQFIPMPVQID